MTDERAESERLMQHASCSLPLASNANAAPDACASSVGAGTTLLKLGLLRRLLLLGLAVSSHMGALP